MHVLKVFLMLSFALAGTIAAICPKSLDAFLVFCRGRLLVLPYVF